MTTLSAFEWFAELWWWIVFATILLSGVGGGIARFIQWRAKTEEPGWIASAVVGVAAAFLVPMFLNSISSALIAQTREHPEKLFVLIGFCVAAAYFAQQFIDSVGRRALRISREAKAIAKTAERTARSATDHAHRANNRAVAMWKVMQLVDNNQYADALAAADRVLATDPDHAGCLAWRAYCLKRLHRPAEAVGAIDRALALEGTEVFSWLFNAACYRALVDTPFIQIKPLLLRAWHCATSSQRDWLIAALASENDLERVRNDPEFSALVSTFERKAS